MGTKMAASVILTHNGGTHPPRHPYVKATRIYFIERKVKTVCVCAAMDVKSIYVCTSMNVATDAGSLRLRCYGRKVSLRL